MQEASREMTMGRQPILPRVRGTEWEVVLVEPWADPVLAVACLTWVATISLAWEVITRGQFSLRQLRPIPQAAKRRDHLLLECCSLPSLATGPSPASSVTLRTRMKRARRVKRGNTKGSNKMNSSRTKTTMTTSKETKATSRHRGSSSQSLTSFSPRRKTSQRKEDDQISLS